MTFSEDFESKMIIEEKVPPKIKRNFSKSFKEAEENNEDDDLEIPAFIRRKMKK